MERFSLFLSAMISRISILERPFIGQMAPSILVVENLPSDATKNDLEKLFSKMGPLESVDFDSSNRGVVEFCSSNHAKEAMHQLNRTELKGKPINITWCEKQCPCSNAKLSLSIRAVITDDELKALFSAFGAVDSIKVVLHHPDTSYWTLQFDSEISATNAVTFFNGAENHDMKFLVSKYNDCKDLYVKYHPKDLDENYIVSAFSLYGECTVKIEKDKNCKSSGGFVSYHTSEEAKEAMRNLNGAKLDSHHLYVRGIVTQAVIEDNNLEEVFGHNSREVPIFVIEGNLRQLIAHVNMEDLHKISDFLQELKEVWDCHHHIGLLERISLNSPWPGYRVVYTHVNSKNEEDINAWEDVVPCFNEDPNEHFELWFLSSVNKIEFHKISKM